MIAIVKIKMVYNAVRNAKVVWVYNTIDESKIDGLYRGYKIMRRGKDADQYAIDLGFKGEKDKTYTDIEKAIKPLVREIILTNLLEN